MSSSRKPPVALTDPRLLCLLLAIATVALYWPVLGHDFLVYDDPEFVTSNPQVLRGLTWGGAVWALGTAEFANWAPLTWLSHMLDVELYGLRPGGHHLSNLILHVGNTVLLFLVLRGMTGAAGRSAAVSALFALHPLHVESVAWIAERRDLLSVLFGMLALWAYARYTRAFCPGAPPPWSWYLLSLAFFAMGLMSKQLLVTLPCLMLLLDRWPLNRWSPAGALRFTMLRGLILEKLPFFALGLISGTAAYHVQDRAGYLPSVMQFPIPTRVANALLSYVLYLFRTVWPFDLAVFYPYPDSFSFGAVAGAVLLLALITAAALALARRRPYLGVGLAWYLVTLLPVIGLIQTSTHARSDGYTYLPLVGLFIIGVWGVAEIFDRRYRTILCSVGLLMLVACAARARDQLRHWRDTESLFRHALAVTEENAIAHDLVGDSLADKGRTGEAIEHYREALRIEPTYVTALNNLGNVLAREGRLDEALTHYRRAIEIRPGYAAAHYNLGNVLAGTGRVEEAVTHYVQAIESAPSAEASSNLGIALDRLGRVEEAIEYYRRALRLNPDYADAHYNLGVTLAGQGRPELSIEHYRQVLRIRPTDAGAHRKLGNVLAGLGRHDEAEAHLREALRLEGRQVPE